MFKQHSGPYDIQCEWGKLYMLYDMGKITSEELQKATSDFPMKEDVDTFKIDGGKKKCELLLNF